MHFQRLRQKQSMIELIHDSKFQNILLAIDQDLAAKSRAKGCPYCGGVLHSACYPRLLRGASGICATTRHSFCCETCRKRVNPPSVRFFGRRRYSTLSTILPLVLRPEGKGKGKAQQDHICSLLGVSRRTLDRWRCWWRDSFVHTPFWSIARARFMPTVPQDVLPMSLLARFNGNDMQRLLNMLIFISPLSGNRFDQTGRGS